MTDGTGLRLALGALAGLGLGAVGVLVLPPLLVPDPETLGTQSAILPEPGTPLLSTERTSAATNQPPATAPRATASAPVTAPSAPDPAEPPVSTAHSVTTVEPGPAPTASELAPSPGFDAVRMEPDGRGLVAGRAEPGAAVEVLADEQVVAQAEADEEGNFVAFLSLGSSAAPRALSLRDGTGRPSEETVILAPSAAPPSPELSSATAPHDAPAAPEQASPSAPDDEEPAPSPGTRAATVPRTASGEPEGTEPASQVADSPEEAPAGLTGDTEPTRLAVVEPPGADAAGRTPTDPAAPSGAPGQGRADQPEPASPDIMADTPSLGSAAPTLADPGAPALRADEEAPGSASSGLLAASPDAAPQVTAAPSVAVAAPPLPGPEAPQPPGQEPVLLSDADGVRVLQPALPSGADPEVLATVALDAIAYDGAGEVVLSGRANGGTVRLYLDNRPVGEAVIGEDGQWSVPLPGARPGAVHTLRLDQVAGNGQVLSRIETPFRREERSALEAAMAESREPGRTVTLRVVQPGNTLWAIARDRYGEPMMYVQVFEANRDRIRDPDLIYPGQLFVLPLSEEP